MKRWLALAGVSALLAAAWFYRPSMIPATCTMKIMTGFGCPGCGVTRSICSAAHGRLVDSVRLHAFGPLLLLTAIAAWFVFLFNLPVRYDSSWVPRVLVGFVVGLLAYWGIRVYLGAVP